MEKQKRALSILKEKSTLQAHFGKLLLAKISLMRMILRAT